MTRYNETARALGSLDDKDFYLLDLLDEIYNDDSTLVKSKVNEMYHRFDNSGSIITQGKDKLKLAILIRIVDHYIYKDSIETQMKNMENVFGNISDVYLNKLIQMMLIGVMNTHIDVRQYNLGIDLKDISIQYDSKSFMTNIPIGETRIFNDIIVRPDDGVLKINLKDYGHDRVIARSILVYDDSLNFTYYTDYMRFGAMSIKRNELGEILINEIKDIKERSIGLIKLVPNT